MPQPEPEKIELAPDHVIVKSGEVMEGDGRAHPAVWIEGEGRWMRHGNDRVLVFMFLTPDAAVSHALAILKECAVLEIMSGISIEQGGPEQ